MILQVYKQKDLKTLSVKCVFSKLLEKQQVMGDSSFRRWVSEASRELFSAQNIRMVLQQTEVETGAHSFQLGLLQ